MKPNVASQVVDAQLNSRTDGSPVTTGTTTVYVSGDGGPQVAAGGSPSCVHLGNGLWSYIATAAESNYTHVAFTFVNSAAVCATIQIYTSFPQTGDSFVRLGAPAGASVSADVAAVKVDTAAIKTKTDFLPSATAGAAGGVFIAGTNAATAITTSFTTTFTGNLTGSVASVTGAVGSVTGLTASDVGAIKTKTDFLPSATAGAAGGVFIAGTNAATSITTGLTSNLIGNITGNMSGSVGSVTGAVGSVTGLTASDVGAIKTKTDFLPSATAGAAGGVFIAGSNAATSITTALTANIIGDVTGNLSGSVGSLTTNNDKTGYGLSAAAVQAIWDALTSALTTVGSIGKLLVDRMGVLLRLDTTMESTGSPTDYVFTTRALAQAPSGTGASAATIAAAVWDEARAGHVGAGSFGQGVASVQGNVTGTVATVTNLTNAPTVGDLTAAMIASVTAAATAATPTVTAGTVSDKTGYSLSTAGNAAVADKLLGRNLAGGSDGARTVQDALRSLRNKTSITAGTLTVTAEDDTTPAWTAVVTTAPGDPLTSIDPA